MHRITILLLLICSCGRFVADIFQFAKHFRDSRREAGETAVLIYIYIYIYIYMSPYFLLGASLIFKEVPPLRGGCLFKVPL